MKLLKSLALVGILFIINVVNPKGLRRVETTTPIVVQPVRSPIDQPQKTSVQMPSYAQALNTIRTTMRSDQVWRDGQFTGEFINFVKNNASSDIFAKALLQAGANLHVQFTGDNDVDLTIVLDINNAIDRQMKTDVSKPVIQPRVEQPKVIEEPLISKKTGFVPVARMHLVPTDAQTLRNFGLCPLFGQQTIDTVPPHYSFFNENYKTYSGEIRPQFEIVNVPVNAACVVPLGRLNNWNRTLMQLKSLDQFELADKANLSPAMCGGLSLNSGRLIRRYALTGENQCFRDLHDINDAARFLRNLGIEDWLNVEIVRNNLPKLRQELGDDGVDVSAVSTVSLFDSHLNTKPNFSVFNNEEFVYVQNVKKQIQQGLKQENYVHIIIVGNEEAVETLGHYFCFAIIKMGNEIQYIVIDTIPSAYHLQQGSHERDRLMFVIENVEQGRSEINVANIRTRPGFLQSVAVADEESMREAALAKERMKESGEFKDQIKLLNDLSKRLNRFGVKKQLEKESKDNLIDCRNAIIKISDVYGEGFVYPVLKQLIETRLNAL